jgi:hypothetical protein
MLGPQAFFSLFVIPACAGMTNKDVQIYSAIASVSLAIASLTFSWLLNAEMRI